MQSHRWEKFPFGYEKMWEWECLAINEEFHKQNALKAVAFLSTAESPQLRVDTHIRAQVLVCARYR